MKVWIVQQSKCGAKATSVGYQSVWITRDLALEHVHLEAAKIIRTQETVDRKWREFRIEVARVRVTLEGWKYHNLNDEKRWDAIHRWYIEEDELRGDAVSALAKVSADE